MAILLNIDTATAMGSICLSKDGDQLILQENREQKDHASWLHPAIDLALKTLGYGLKDLQAISVSAGPGSYTGLRVAMATAKGFCYALQIPFITESTLKLMAFAAKEQWKGRVQWLCPMIDARRNEVFTAIYDLDLELKKPEMALILDQNAFSEELSMSKIVFFGSGSKKWESICTSHNAFFADVICNAGHLGILAEKKFNLHQFTDISHSEPAYLKEFYTHAKK